jgi:hypothetical protein
MTPDNSYERKRTAILCFLILVIIAGAGWLESLVGGLPS